MYYKTYINFYRCDVSQIWGVGVDLAKHKYYAKNIL